MYIYIQSFFVYSTGTLTFIMFMHLAVSEILLQYNLHVFILTKEKMPEKIVFKPMNDIRLRQHIYTEYSMTWFLGYDCFLSNL